MTDASDGLDGGRLGSTIFPFSLSTLIDRGGDPDAPLAAPARLEIEVPTGSAPTRWAVTGGDDDGIATAKDAVRLGLRTPWAQLWSVGALPLDDLARTASRLHLTDAVDPTTPASVLGVATARPIDVAGAFAVFADAGRHRAPHLLRRVARGDGELLHVWRDEPAQVLDVTTAVTVRQTLESTLCCGTAAGVAPRLRGAAFAHPGTDDGGRSAWFVGATPEVLALVWIGGDTPDGRPLLGSDQPAIAWRSVMDSALDASLDPTPATSTPATFPDR